MAYRLSPETLESLPVPIQRLIKDSNWWPAVASLGVHGIIFAALPFVSLPDFANEDLDIQRQVSVVELGAEELSRVPDFSGSTLQIPSVPTQDDFDPFEDFSDPEPEEDILSPLAPPPSIDVLTQLSDIYGRAQNRPSSGNRINWGTQSQSNNNTTANTDSGSTDSGSTDSGSTDSGSTDSDSTDSGSTDSTDNTDSTDDETSSNSTDSSDATTDNTDSTDSTDSTDETDTEVASNPSSESGDAPPISDEQRTAALLAEQQALQQLFTGSAPPAADIPTWSESVVAAGITPLASGTTDNPFFSETVPYPPTACVFVQRGVIEAASVSTHVGLVITADNTIAAEPEPLILVSSEIPFFDQQSLAILTESERDWGNTEGVPKSLIVQVTFDYTADSCPAGSAPPNQEETV